MQIFYDKHFHFDRDAIISIEKLFIVQHKLSMVYPPSFQRIKPNNQILFNWLLNESGVNYIVAKQMMI